MGTCPHAPAPSWARGQDRAWPSRRDWKPPIGHPHAFPALVLAGGAALIANGIRGGGYLLAAWLGANLVILGLAHLCGIHNLFGKRPDGRLPGSSRLLFWPLLGCSVALWHLHRLTSREPAGQSVNAQLVVGRRLLTAELDRADECENFVDLTAELVAPARVRQRTAYRCFPILDGVAPEPEALWAAVASLRPGRTFVHCAQGRGRTGLFALALLLHTGQVRDMADGLRLLQVVRPSIALSPVQRRCIERYAQALAAARSAPPA